MFQILVVTWPRDTADTLAAGQSTAAFMLWIGDQKKSHHELSSPFHLAAPTPFFHHATICAGMRNLCSYNFDLGTRCTVYQGAERRLKKSKPLWTGIGFISRQLNETSLVLTSFTRQNTFISVQGTCHSLYIIYTAATTLISAGIWDQCKSISRPTKILHKAFSNDITNI